MKMPLGRRRIGLIKENSTRAPTMRFGKLTGPAGVVDSRTCCEGLRGAATADNRAMIGLGEDFERADIGAKSVLCAVRVKVRKGEPAGLFTWGGSFKRAEIILCRACTEAGTALVGFESAGGLHIERWDVTNQLGMRGKDHRRDLGNNGPPGGERSPRFDLDPLAKLISKLRIRFEQAGGSCGQEAVG